MALFALAENAPAKGKTKNAAGQTQRHSRRNDRRPRRSKVNPGRCEIPHAFAKIALGAATRCPQTNARRLGEFYPTCGTGATRSQTSIRHAIARWVAHVSRPVRGECTQTTRIVRVQNFLDGDRMTCVGALSGEDVGQRQPALLIVHQ